MDVASGSHSIWGKTLGWSLGKRVRSGIGSRRLPAVHGQHRHLLALAAEGRGCIRVSPVVVGTGEVGHCPEGQCGERPPAWVEPCLCASYLHTHGCLGTCPCVLTSSRVT